MTALLATYADFTTTECEVIDSEVDATVEILMEAGAIMVSIGKSQL
jgi:hypothetical protein